MKKDSTKLVKDVIGMSADMSALTQDKVNETAPKSDDLAEVKLTAKQIAARDGVKYIEPKKRLPAFGANNLKAEWKPKRERDWEYILGMFQGEVVNGAMSREPKTFWHSKWPGDDDCLWEIPVETPVYVPRMIARLLSGEKEDDTGMECMKYHKFDYIERPQTTCRPDEYMHQFTAVATNYRGRFVPIGQFS